jgi:hypothetical protein
MARYEVVIETRGWEDGGFTGAVVKGPRWAVGHVCTACTRRAHAFQDAADALVQDFPQHTFEFLHAES